MTQTIRDVAKKCGLSITTVSRALDGYGDVAESTRQLVISTAREMGYVPNRAARELRRQRTETIGYVMPVEKASAADPFFAEFVAGMTDEASAGGLDLMVASAAPGGEAEREVYQKWVQGHKVDGIILNRVRLKDWRIRYLAGQNVPFASLERSREAVEHPFIHVDAASGMQALVRELATLGHRRIAYIGSRQELAIETERYLGYLSGLEACNLELDESLVREGDLGWHGGYQAVMELLEYPHPPTAVMCVNDWTAFGVLHAVHESGLTPGKDLAVTGFDGLEESATTFPPLTTLHQPVYDIGRRLVRMVEDVLIKDGLPPQPVEVPVSLILRASSGHH